MTKRDVVQSVLRYWRANDVAWLRGNSEARLRDFAKRFNVTMPLEFVGLYRSSDGTRVPGTPGADQRGFDFWRLDEIRPTYHTYPWAFMFADFLQCASYLAIDFSGDGGAGAGAVYAIQDDARVIAPSFGKFLAIYVNEDNEQLFPRNKVSEDSTSS